MDWPACKKYHPIAHAPASARHIFILHGLASMQQIIYHPIAHALASARHISILHGLASMQK
jgi:hypothetical protein